MTKSLAYKPKINGRGRAVAGKWETIKNHFRNKIQDDTRIYQ